MASSDVSRARSSRTLLFAGGVLALSALLALALGLRPERRVSDAAREPQASTETRPKSIEPAQLGALESGAEATGRQETSEPDPRAKADEPRVVPESAAATRRAREAEKADEPATSATEAPAGPSASVRGSLLREGGPWTSDNLPKPNSVMLDLVAQRAPHTSWRARIEPKQLEQGEVQLEFRFDDVPPGEYELTLSALGSWRWAPHSLHVRAPAQGITFVRYDLDARVPLAFEVVDRADGARITSYQTRHLQLTPSADVGVFLQTGPLELEDFPLQSRFRWSLWAPGYAPAFGDETAFERRGEQRIARVELARGWATQVLVLARDPVARPVAGAEIWLDGQRVGWSDSEGWCVVASAAAPTSLRVTWKQWASQGNLLGAVLGKSAEQRGQITLAMLEREP